jgi:hypothetical protein
MAGSKDPIEDCTSNIIMPILEELSADDQQHFEEIMK